MKKHIQLTGLCTMPKYFFHIKRGSELVRDEEGSDLADAAVAYGQALACAREILTTAIAHGQDLDGEALVVTDEGGKQAVFVPLVEALPPRIRGLSRR